MPRHERIQHADHRVRAYASGNYEHVITVQITPAPEFHLYVINEYTKVTGEADLGGRSAASVVLRILAPPPQPIQAEHLPRSTTPTMILPTSLHQRHGNPALAIESGAVRGAVRRSQAVRRHILHGNPPPWTMQRPESSAAAAAVEEAAALH